MKEAKANPKPPPEPEVDYAAVTQPAPGGTLADYVAHEQAAGRHAVLTAGGTQAWIGGVGGELLRLPMECTDPPDANVVRNLLRLRKIWMVSYLLPPDEAHPANCFDYVCRTSDYVIDGLSSHARRDIRRGLRSFTVRLCRWDELADRGHPAAVDTAARHGYVEPASDKTRRFVAQREGSPLFEIWGAWEGDDLAAWMSVAKVDDWAVIDLCRSRTDALRNCPNNALLYAATRRLMVEEKRTYVSYGLSSLQVDVNELSMHKYKVRMEYEALPMRRTFVLHPLLRPLLASPLASRAWQRLAKARPQFSALRKAAGLARLLSGEETSPLAWAEPGPPAEDAPPADSG